MAQTNQTVGGDYMLKAFGIEKGVNLGGWMSQCDYSQQRLDTFIREEDIARIASWGADHVRLPVDYNVFETEDGFRRVQQAIDWCRAHGLKLVLDLHKTWGFSFDKGEAETGFFHSEAYQEKFYRLWEEFARRWGSEPEQVAFELLNEVTDEAYMPAWNRIAAVCIRRIRAIAPRTYILVGGYHNNQAYAVPALDKPADDRVLYNFHCYLPLNFTHQGAYWVDGMPRDFRQGFDEAGVDDEFFDRCFAPAVETAAARGTALYCGEYGVINLANPEDTLRWYRRIHEAFQRYGIARCAWSYKEMDFGLADAHYDGVREKLVKLL